jgi:hypothetical protein
MTAPAPASNAMLSLSVERITSSQSPVVRRVVHARVGAWTGSADLVLLLQLATQFVFYLAMYLYSPRQTLTNVAAAYATVFLLQAIEWRLVSGLRFRVLTSVAMCNTICLFYAAGPGQWRLQSLLIALGWLSRTLIVNREGRHIFNPGTFGVFWGGLLCSSGLQVGAWVHPISHGFTHVPHFTLVVVGIGALIAWLGGHLDVVVPILAGTFLTRGFPSSAELIIFLFAATDPVTIPRKFWHRVQFGLTASMLTGVLWRFTSNELVKVGGLMATGLLMQLFVRFDYAPWMRRTLGRYGDEAFWSRPKMRLLGVLVVLVYGLAADVVYPHRKHEVSISVRDAQTGVELGRDAARELFAGDILAQYDATTLNISWADLYGAWNWTSHGTHPGQIQPGARVRLRYHLACRPDVEETSVRFIDAPRVEASEAHGVAGGADLRILVLSVHVDAIRTACRAR